MPADPVSILLWLLVLIVAVALIVRLLRTI